ncbi:unnamed protein product [Rangifer tarandus platyrhynchus]|uniref:Uncharacterized protein n=1 Tax=Rangifer tarandus platyrhynchus TaxID=3082113 RepID=A0ABN8XZT0_RANTA|nr:unnamed protein product [Rangifer tarandus platyrhynchus]
MWSLPDQGSNLCPLHWQVDSALKNLSVAMSVSVAQSCPTLCGPVDCSPPGSSVHGILQARALQWVPIPSSGDLPDPGINPEPPAPQADSLLSEPQGGPFIFNWRIMTSQRCGGF